MRWNCIRWVEYSWGGRLCGEISGGIWVSALQKRNEVQVEWFCTAEKNEA